MYSVRAGHCVGETSSCMEKTLSHATEVFGAKSRACLHLYGDRDYLRQSVNRDA